jgi:predicted AlkP superfamily pyrophosphatase or phosphodiesterase
LNRRLRFCLALALSVAVSCGRPAPAPLLILISFDGWRADYIDRASVPSLKALAARGVRAAGLVPSFPAMTFPNHYTIVTGLRPEHHGIVANTIADPAFPERFTMSAATAKDPRWWGGEPIWVSAVRQGRRAATMFWPGSEVAIGGVRPTYWQPYKQETSNADRVAQVLTWLALPDTERPSFVSVYFEEVDSAGHDGGPDSPALWTAAEHLDAALGQLVDGVRRLGLDDRATIVAVSDHGMTPLSEDRAILLDDYVDLKDVDVIELGAFVQLAPRSGSVDALYAQLHDRHPHLAIYKRDKTPERFHYRDNPRIAPIVGIPDDGWDVTSRARLERRQRNGTKPMLGAHGFDPGAPAMRALFVAAGPRVRRGVVVEPFENIHVYDFLCAVLGLTPAPNDGNPSVTRAFLR